MKRVWDRIEHVGVHVGMNSPVIQSIVPRGHENRVTLSHREVDDISWAWLGIGLNTIASAFHVT